MDVIRLTPRRWWWVLLLLFVAHQVLQKGLNIAIPWADAYLDNLLCMPLLLGFWQWERRRLWGAPPLRAWEIVLATLLFAFLFEWAFPRWSPSFVADWWDVLAYSIGSLAFWWGRGE